MSKFIQVFSVFFMVFVAQAAEARDRVQEAAEAVFWEEFSQEYKDLRATGGRFGADGKTHLTPVKGERGGYQDPNGYRYVHQSDCQREGNFSRLFGSLVTLGTATMGNQYWRAGGPTGVQVLQQQAGISRYYKCAEREEMYNFGNKRLVQQRVEAQQIEIARNQSASAEEQTPAAQDGPDPFMVKFEARCEATYKQCPAGKDWGPFDKGDRLPSSERYVCKCR